MVKNNKSKKLKDSSFNKIKAALEANSELALKAALFEKYHTTIKFFIAKIESQEEGLRSILQNKDAPLRRKDAVRIQGYISVCPQLQTAYKVFQEIDGSVLEEQFDVISQKAKITAENAEQFFQKENAEQSFQKSNNKFSDKDTAYVCAYANTWALEFINFLGSQVADNVVREDELLSGVFEEKENAKDIGFYSRLYRELYTTAFMVAGKEKFPAKKVDITKIRCHAEAISIEKIAEDMFKREGFPKVSTAGRFFIAAREEEKKGESSYSSGSDYDSRRGSIVSNLGEYYSENLPMINKISRANTR